MTDFPVFPNAPITEALIDIRAKLPQNIDLSILEKIHDKIKNRFPEKGKKRSFEAKFDFKEDILDSTTKGETNGFLFRSPAGQKIFQATLDGFTFNKLKPYDRWVNFKTEAQELWRLYSEETNPISVSRVALRYINRIEIPLPISNLKDYILTSPEIAPDIKQEPVNFFMQYIAKNNDINATAIITETIAKQPIMDTLPLIFDIDVFIEKNYEVSNSSIWDDLDKLRDYKNSIFLNSLTEKAKELFK